MSAKNKDSQGRWRNKTVAFRVSSEEDARIESAVRMTGLTKQDYITRRLEDTAVTVQGNPRVFRGLRLEMRKLGEELKRLHTGEKIPEDILFKLRMLLSVMDGMKEEGE
jgi:hypothetical protein